MLGTKSIKVNGAEVGIESIMLGVITSIGGFLFGYDTGQISSMLLFTDFRNRFATGPRDEDGIKTWVSIIQSLMVSLMSIGTLIGALSGAYTADWWGRRKSLTFGVCIFIVGNIIQITAMDTWVHMMMGRFVAGLGVSNLSVGVPMYQSECSPRQIRGAVVASYQLLITIGILVSNIINYGVRNIQTSDASWRIVIGLGILFSLPLGIGILMVPESPRWLAARHDWEGARMSLARLRGMKDDPHNTLVEDDINEMYKVLEEESRVGVGSWMECFTGRPARLPKLVYRTLLGMTLHFLQQWTGVNYFFYYGATIFESAGVDDPILVQLILGAVNVVTTFYGLYVVEKYGRRWALFIGGLWQAAWLCVFASIGVAQPPDNNSTTGIVMIVFGLHVHCLFRRASLATAGNWLGNFMIAFLSPLADAGIGYAFGYVFVACNLAGALVVWFFLYESRGLSLENVDRMYGQKDVKPWNSNKWVPPGYLTRETRDEATFRRASAARGSVAHTSSDVEKEKRHDDSPSESHHEGMFSGRDNQV
ncbi:high-affinity glucose transporter ght2 [Verticillium alfalfae VaMs.102]|uniref:High-affinity glucose transporter ght2 n=1 Tax=Verticillium alfalfae (strain VaMs.102 / ATCC MYA-4576 / FGSC 10136) TaxID=526221 RepID=C9SUA0_VERA1|nr:high-affinity glucose transporter ght2 [Verticillium alfalfae VaMs.102]EEY22411.1 high-affinity glucose transporter ght2 [Verticillium alfalfae VaMs.102]